MRYPDADWRPSPNHGGLLVSAIGFIEHVEAGTEIGTETVFANPNYQASSHFGFWKDGRVDQFVDTDIESWAQVEGNASYFSGETEGYPTEPLTDAQVVSFAKVYAWCQQLHNAHFGFTLAEQPGDHGLGWHGMGGKAWGGHYDCPGDLRKAQRPRILALASPPSNKDGLLMSAALNDDDARRTLIRLWFKEHLGRGFKPGTYPNGQAFTATQEQDLHTWVAGTQGLDIALAGILDSPEAQAYSPYK